MAPADGTAFCYQAPGSSDRLQGMRSASAIMLAPPRLKSIFQVMPIAMPEHFLRNPLPFEFINTNVGVQNVGDSSSFYAGRLRMVIWHIPKDFLDITCQMHIDQ